MQEFRSHPPSQERGGRASASTSLPAQAVPYRFGVAALPLIALLMAGEARAHDAPTGWSYPFSCCSNYDCRAVATKAVSERPEGYQINTTGEVISYQDVRIRNSPDGEFHWCSVAGEETSRTICLFVPPRAY